MLSRHGQILRGGIKIMTNLIDEMPPVMCKNTKLQQNIHCLLHFSFSRVIVRSQFNTKDAFGIPSETGSGGTLEISLNREPKVQGESRISQANGQSGNLAMQPFSGCC
jgi:hypothetical protein